MRKKGQVTSTLVIMIAGALALLVLLIVTGTFAKVFQSITGKNQCQMQFLISSFTKTAGAQTVEPECEPHLITIDQQTLDNGRAAAAKSIQDYSVKFTGKGIDTATNYINYFSVADSTLSAQRQNEWVMDKTVADEMKYCWDIAGQGKLDLFSDWWKLAQCKRKDGTSCTADDITGLNWDSAKNAFSNGVSLAWPPNWDVTKTPPAYCVICSRIKFDSNLQNAPKTVDKLGLWMDNNPVTDVGTYSKVPYSAYLQNDAYKGIFTSPTSYPYDTNQAYAVLYERINVFKGTTWLHKTINIATGATDDKLPQAIQMIKLVPYNTIQNECVYLVG